MHSKMKQAHSDLSKKVNEQGAELTAGRKETASLQRQIDDERVSRCEAQRHHCREEGQSR